MDGNILDAQISTQIAVLNQVYNPIGFSFVLQATDRTVNADWFQNMVSGSSQESAAQSALHTGNMGTVRIMLISEPCCLCRPHLRRPDHAETSHHHVPWGGSWLLAHGTASVLHMHCVTLLASCDMCAFRA